MKESEIWREVGRRLETKTTKSTLTNPNTGSVPLCFEFDNVWRREHNSPCDSTVPYIVARNRVSPHIYAGEFDSYAYNDPSGLAENHEGRILAAYWLALEAEEEENATN